MELEQKIVEYLQKTESLIVEEAPVFIQEAINFYFYKELVYLVESLAILFILFYCVRYILSEKYKQVLINLDCPDSNLLQKLSLLFPSVAIFLILFNLTCNLIDFIQICIAPRLYLLERLVN